MDDQRIIELYFERSEAAITATKDKYDRYCTAIAYHILGSFEETEECVADTYLKVWNTIPPKKPENLKAYIGKITSNHALSRYRASHAKKRSAFAEVLEELEIADLQDPCDELERKELAGIISSFLRKLPPLKRRIFILRYWHYQPLKTISKGTGLKEERISVELYRIRKKLKHYLEQEGYTL